MVRKLFSLACVGVLCACAGCFSPKDSPAAYQAADQPCMRTAAKDRSALAQAIVKSATCRHWLPTEVRPGVYRLKLVQRNHFVEIEIGIVGETNYSLTFVDANIPCRKYVQWIGNLEREIAKRAAP